MKIYNTLITNKPVENIAYNAAAGVVTFDFMGGAPAVTLDAPVATSPGDITNDGFTAYWSPVAGAETYTLHLQGNGVEQEYEYITSTRYTLTGLASGTYYYKVKAVSGESESAYSNVIEVVVTDESALPGITQSALRAYAAAGSIVLESDEPCKATVYNAQGIPEATVAVDGSCQYRPRQSGLYIVACGEAVFKLVVK